MEGTYITNQLKQSIVATEENASVAGAANLIHKVPVQRHRVKLLHDQVEIRIVAVGWRVDETFIFADERNSQQHDFLHRDHNEQELDGRLNMIDDENVQLRLTSNIPCFTFASSTLVIVVVIAS